ncbi:MAG TPA: HlyC/CorC family transporter [Tissierellia bacterium]|nr:HlyC/CorC family transporter [Tissierellia bacterium]
MDPSDAGQIVFLVILLSLSAFFSASETAMMSLSKIRLRHMQEAGVPRADTISRLIEQPNRFLGSILVGNNLVNIAASAIATVLFTKYFPGLGAAIATAVMTVLILIFGEITPKSVAAANSERASLRLAPMVSVVIKLFSPITRIIMFVTNGFVRLLGGSTDLAQPFITQEELKTIVNVSHEEGVLEGDERKMINNVFAFGDSQAKDVMTPRTDMIAINLEATYDDVVCSFKTEQFSRIPVYQETPDDIVGVIYIKDLILNNVTRENFVITEVLREPYFTYEFKRTAQLFEDMRQKHIPIAIVLDEYGGTAGVVTMEDLVEEIVGDIADEYDLHEDEIEVIQEDEYIVDGAARIELVNEMIGTRFESEDFDSIGGFVLGELGGLPEPGEIIQIDGVTFKVEEIDKNRIETLRIETK